MKLETGMYCRYNNFQNKIKIAKIKGIQKADEVFQYDYINFDNDDGELETNIIKASYNIIDILEKGDYVNGSKVIDISIIGKDKEKWVWVEQTEDNDNKYGDDYVGYNNEQIKSIVTKEQMEQMVYKVEE